MEQIIRVTAAAFSDFALDVELLTGVQKDHEKVLRDLERRNANLLEVSERLQYNAIQE